MEGFFNINKPKGLSSYDVIRYLKKYIKGRKIGHSGNLDPGATGVIVIGVGRATKFLEYITGLRKEYIGRIKLGILTDTLDSDGTVIEEKEIPKFGREGIIDVLKQFQGKIQQVPPEYSALKIKGSRMYDLARHGIYVKRKPREVEIYRMELVEYGENHIDIKTTVSKGTYIRSLARDIGEALGTVGIVDKLCRLSVGNFNIEKSIPLNDIKMENLMDFLIPLDAGLSFFSRITLSERASEHFREGNIVSKAGIIRKDHMASVFQHVRVYDVRENFIGIGFLKWEGVVPKKVIP